jgi:DNA mismatch endonuclease (patch repair protein)
VAAWAPPDFAGKLSLRDEKGKGLAKAAATPMDRSAVMRAVKGRDTTPEMVVRKMLREFAPGYRLHRRDLPGAPDIAYIGRKKAIFVHGCFWHGHDCKRGARMPKTNADYWTQKIARNRARDETHLIQYEARGWEILTVWECETRDKTTLTTRLRAFLSMPLKSCSGGAADQQDAHQQR